MLALGDLWVIIGTASLALALEMIWFSSIGFGSWLNHSAPDQWESYSIKRLIVSFLAFLAISGLIFLGLGLGINWLELLIIGVGLIISTNFVFLSRHPMPLKPLIAEWGFSTVLLGVMTYVIAAWPW